MIATRSTTVRGMTMRWKLPLKSTGLTLLALFAGASSAHGESQRYAVVANGRNVGYLRVEGDQRRSTIDFDYKINGRGPSSKETMELDSQGLPVRWVLEGATTFGSKTQESFELKGKNASWTDAAGPGTAAAVEPSLYVAQNASPWAHGV